MGTQTETQEMEALQGKVDATIAAVQMLIAIGAKDEGTREVLKKALELFQSGHGNDVYKATLDTYLEYARLFD